MAKVGFSTQAFNRGLISPLALARIDLDRVRLSAEVQRNWMPRSLGSMMLRPGLGYVGGIHQDARAKFLPFIFATEDTALVEITDGSLRVWVDDAVVTRAAVSSAVSNGGFDTDLTGWTDVDQSGAASTWATGGFMSLLGTGTTYAIRRQTVTVGVPDQNVRHALRVVIERGPVRLRVGVSAGDGTYIDSDLQPGVHSLAFTPVGDFHIELAARQNRVALVDSVAVDAFGAMVLPSPWGEDDLSLIRVDQSGDVLFVAVDGYQQRRIERRAVDSWSVVKYLTEDGPFRVQNVGPVTLTASALTGNITLTASEGIFTTDNVGSLYSITSTGQTVDAAFTAENQFSDPIRVTGVDETRRFTINITGTFTATLTLQRSVGEVGSWEDVTTYTTPQSTTYVDGLANQIIFYRIGVKTGDYTSGTADIMLSYPLGSITGVVRVTSYTSATVVSAEVLTALGGTGATDIWAEGEWSGRRGWPSSVAFYEGRLWWAGKDRIWGSVSDAFSSFDADTEGDSAPIARGIGSGPVDTINFLLPIQRLLLGTDGAESSVRSTTFDEPLTATNFNIKAASTQGSARVGAVRVDSRGFFVQRSGQRVFELVLDPGSADYVSTDRTEIVPEIGLPSITTLAVQRQPDTRVHCVRGDGTVAVLIFQAAENVSCWVEVETDGVVEDAVVLPGSVEDAVYYVVKRTIGGVDKRFLERWAREDTCTGFQEARLADSYVLYSGAEATTITGLSHLEGESVVVWGWNTVNPFTVVGPDGVTRTVGRDLGTYTVTGGQITGMSSAVTDACVGLGYTAQYKSTKLSYLATRGGAAYAPIALTKTKAVTNLGMILRNAHTGGILYGRDSDNLDALPLMLENYPMDPDYIWPELDMDAVVFSGRWGIDQRVCLQAAAPRPVTLLALVVGMETNE